MNFIRIGSLKLIPVRRENSLVCSAEKLACKRLSLLTERLFRALNGKRSGSRSLGSTIIKQVTTYFFEQPPSTLCLWARGKCDGWPGWALLIC